MASLKYEIIIINVQLIKWLIALPLKDDTSFFAPETQHREHDVFYAVEFLFCSILIRSVQIIIIMIYWFRFHRNWISVRDTQQHNENDSLIFFFWTGIAANHMPKICESFFDNDNINLQAHLSRNMIWKFWNNAHLRYGRTQSFVYLVSVAAI